MEQDRELIGALTPTEDLAGVLSVAGEPIYLGGSKVTSVNGKIGDVVLDYSDVHALPEDTELFSGDYNDLINKPTIPSIEGLATEEYVDNKIEEIEDEIPDLTGYATETWVNNQGFLKEHQSLDGYATEE